MFSQKKRKYSADEARVRVLDDSWDDADDDVALDSSESDSDCDDGDETDPEITFIVRPPRRLATLRSANATHTAAGPSGTADVGLPDRISDTDRADDDAELDAVSDDEAEGNDSDSDTGGGDRPVVQAAAGGWVCPPLNWAVARNEEPEQITFTANPGILVDRTVLKKPIDFVQLFVTDDFVNHLVTQTNLYGDQYVDSHPDMRPHALGRKWKEEHTDSREMKLFLGLVLLMGIIRKPTVASYWTRDVLYDTPLFRAVLSRNRFQTLQKFFHFNDSSNEPDRNDPTRDRLYKVRPVIDHMFEQFQTVYQPEKDIAVDESLLMWKGRLLFRQYIPMKRARFGIKLFCLCETSGYIFRFRVYTGKDDRVSSLEGTLPPDAPKFLKTEELVVHMVQPLLDRGYHLFMDNWFSRVSLYWYLYHHQTLATGTVRVHQVC